MPTWLYPEPGVKGPIDTIGLGPSAPWSTFDSVTNIRYMHVSPSTTATSTVETFSWSETSTVSGYAARVLTLVSGQLAAQTIDGTILVWFPTMTSSAAAAMVSELYVRVVSGDGSSTRGVLYSGLNALSGVSDWVTNSQHYFRTFPDDQPAGVTLNPVTCFDGDRIVVELGFRAFNTSFTEYTGYIYVTSDWAGTTGADESHAQTLGYDPEITFSDTITFKDSPTGTVDVTVDPTATRTVSTNALSRTGTVDVTVDPTATRTVGTAAFMPSTLSVGVNLSTPAMRTGGALRTTGPIGAQVGVNLSSSVLGTVALAYSCYVDVNTYAGLRLVLPAPTPPAAPASPINSGGGAPPAAVGAVPVPKIRRISETYPTPTITNGRPT